MKKHLSKDDKQFKLYADLVQKHQYQCSCGHKVIIGVHYDKKLCTWCNNYVFKDKKEEFKHKIKQGGIKCI